VGRSYIEIVSDSVSLNGLVSENRQYEISASHPDNPFDSRAIVSILKSPKSSLGDLEIIQTARSLADGAQMSRAADEGAWSEWVSAGTGGGGGSGVSYAPDGPQAFFNIGVYYNDPVEDEYTVLRSNSIRNDDGTGITLNENGSFTITEPGYYKFEIFANVGNEGARFGLANQPPGEAISATEFSTPGSPDKLTSTMYFVIELDELNLPLTYYVVPFLTQDGQWDDYVEAYIHVYKLDTVDSGTRTGGGGGGSPEVFLAQIGVLHAFDVEPPLAFNDGLVISPATFCTYGALNGMLTFAEHGYYRIIATASMSDAGRHFALKSDYGELAGETVISTISGGQNGSAVLTYINAFERDSTFVFEPVLLNEEEEAYSLFASIMFTVEKIADYDPEA
jgi:hypothetical protein